MFHCHMLAFQRKCFTSTFMVHVPCHARNQGNQINQQTVNFSKNISKTYMFTILWDPKTSSLSQCTLKKKSLNGLFSLLNIRHPKKLAKFSHWPSKLKFLPTVRSKSIVKPPLLQAKIRSTYSIHRRCCNPRLSRPCMHYLSPTARLSGTVGTR